jgi:hypothetical protein
MRTHARFDQDDGDMTLEDVRAAFCELERLGLARKTGEVRNGSPVYVATPKGIALASAHGESLTDQSLTQEGEGKHTHKEVRDGQNLLSHVDE